MVNKKYVQTNIFIPLFLLLGFKNITVLGISIFSLLIPSYIPTTHLFSFILCLVLTDPTPGFMEQWVNGE